MQSRRIVVFDFAASWRSIALAFAALLGAIGQKSAIAEIGDGSFSFSLSTQTQFLNTTIVDSLTLQPLPSAFAADEQGAFLVAGLILLDGDVTSPIGRIEFSGQSAPAGNLTIAEWDAFIELDIESAAAEADAYFASLLGNVETDDFAPSGGSLVTTTQHTAVTVTPESLSQVLVSTRPFLGTPDGKEAAVPGADISGLADLTGVTEQTAGPTAAPDVPLDSNASVFNTAAFQHDLAVFLLVQNASFNVESLGQMVIEIARIPGDFDGDGDVDGDDFLVWQAGFPELYDGDDFLEWQANFGTVGAQANSANAVPEPPDAALLLLACLTSLVVRPRCF